MEPEKQELPHTRRENDVDLGFVLYKFGLYVKSFFQFLGSVLIAFGELLLNFAFFIRRNLIWLILAFALGAGYGYYQIRKIGSTYYSTMTVRSNFNSTRALYNTVEYINALRSAGDVAQLASLFRMSESEAASIMRLSVEPVETEVLTAQMYYDQFLARGRFSVSRNDTFARRIIKYEDFKSNLTDYDFPVQEIEARSSNPRIFPKIQDGLVALVSNVDVLRKIQDKSREIYAFQQQTLRTAIEGLDTLRSSYNDRLKNPGQSGSSTQVNVLDGRSVATAPELELYDKMLELSDELKNSSNQAVVMDNILQVYAPFSAMGTREPIYRQAIFSNAVLATFIVLLLLLGIRGYGLLRAMELKDGRATKRGPNSKPLQEA